MFQATEFLLIENNPADIRLTEEYFKEHKILNRLCTVSNETEALRRLRRQDEHAQAPLPDVILVSIALLWMDGCLLRQYKSDPSLPPTSIVVLTSGDTEKDSLNDDSAVSLFVSKPLDLERMLTIVRQIDNIAVTFTRNLPFHGSAPAF